MPTFILSIETNSSWTVMSPFFLPSMFWFLFRPDAKCVFFLCLCVFVHLVSSLWSGFSFEVYRQLCFLLLCHYVSHALSTVILTGKSEKPYWQWRERVCVCVCVSMYVCVCLCFSEYKKSSAHNSFQQFKI